MPMIYTKVDKVLGDSKLASSKEGPSICYISSVLPQVKFAVLCACFLLSPVLNARNESKLETSVVR